MDIREVSISSINPAIYNPRVDLSPKDPEYQKLKQSISTFGYVEPIVWNRRTGNLVGGHQRLKILIEQGLQSVQASVVDLPLDQEKALNLALNKIKGAWDNEKLAVLLDELTKLPDFDVSITGFSPLEIGQIFDRYGEHPDADNFDFQAVVESIKEPVTKKGDLILLGAHRLACADATNKEDVHALLQGEKVALLDIDWPYNVNYMGGSCPRVDTRPKGSRKWDAIYSDNMPQDEYEAFMLKVLVNIKPYLNPGAAFYQWQAHRQLGPLYQILTQLDFHVSCLICWAKESAAISYADYSFQTEQAVYGFLKGQSHYFAGKPGESNLWQVKRDPTKFYLHPCQKPAALAERAISNSSKRDDVVLDVFLGSGSVLMAAETLGRRCFGMELDPCYCDAIVKRYINFVGEDKVSQELRDKYLSKEVAK
ncbi:MAG: DNA methyltransferase [Candidatus Omnitrophica bacterium]|nr:DNA methyltransferase [Candidatus Omnitrophota bacterium]